MNAWEWVGFIVEVATPWITAPVTGAVLTVMNALVLLRVLSRRQKLYALMTKTESKVVELTQVLAGHTDSVRLDRCKKLIWRLIEDWVIPDDTGIREEITTCLGEDVDWDAEDEEEQALQELEEGRIDIPCGPGVDIELNRVEVVDCSQVKNTAELVKLVDDTVAQRKPDFMDLALRTPEEKAAVLKRVIPKTPLIPLAPEVVAEVNAYADKETERLKKQDIRTPTDRRQVMQSCSQEEVEAFAKQHDHISFKIPGDADRMFSEWTVDSDDDRNHGYRAWMLSQLKPGMVIFNPLMEKVLNFENGLYEVVSFHREIIDSQWFTLMRCLVRRDLMEKAEYEISQRKLADEREDLASGGLDLDGRPLDSDDDVVHSSEAIDPCKALEIARQKGPPVVVVRGKASDKEIAMKAKQVAHYLRRGQSVRLHAAVDPGVNSIPLLHRVTALLSPHAFYKMGTPENDKEWLLESVLVAQPDLTAPALADLNNAYEKAMQPPLLAPAPVSTELPGWAVGKVGFKGEGYIDDTAQKIVRRIIERYLNSTWQVCRMADLRRGDVWRVTNEPAMKRNIMIALTDGKVEADGEAGVNAHEFTGTVADGVLLCITEKLLIPLADISGGVRELRLAKAEHKDEYDKVTHLSEELRRIGGERDQARTEVSIRDQDLQAQHAKYLADQRADRACTRAWAKAYLDVAEVLGLKLSEHDALRIICCTGAQTELWERALIRATVLVESTHKLTVGCAELNDQVSSTESQRDNFRNEVEELKTENTKLMRLWMQVGRALDVVEQVDGSARVFVDKVVERVGVLQSELKVAKGSQDHKPCAAAQSERDRKINELTKQADELRGMVKDLNRQYDSMQIKLKDACERYTALVEIKNNQQDVFTDDRKRMTAEKDELSRCANDAVKLKDMAEWKLATLDAELKAARGRLAATRAMLDGAAPPS